MENKELIWVDKDLATKYEELDSDIKRVEMVNEIIKDKKHDITSDIQNLDDDLLRFRAFALNYSTKFKEAYDEQVIQLEKIWSDCSKPIEIIDRKTQQMKGEIFKISKTVDSLSSKLENLKTYKIERVIELINTYNNMNEKDKEIFNIILNSSIK